MIRRWLGRLRLAEEILFFGRLSGYALFIGLVYWFLTYEVAGSVMLIGVGIAAGVAAAILFWRSPDRAAGRGGPGALAGIGARGVPAEPQPRAGAAGMAGAPRPDGPFGDDGGRVPVGSLAPLGIGIGVAVVTLGLVFGPWLVLAGLALAASSARTWLGEVSREWLADDQTR